jgi:hypothetical protein
VPISAENVKLYPKEWPLISLTIRALAGFKCEWCEAKNGWPHPETGSRVVLTVAHMNHRPQDCGDRANLKALCQKCHLNYDRHIHMRNSAETRRKRMRTLDMFEAAD